MRKWIPLTAILLGTFMLLVDVTIVNVALPAIARGLSTSFSSLQWVVDGYALALAALLLGVGTLADGAGHRRFYVSGLVLFAVSSLVCGLAPDPALLIGARLVQGVGGAAMLATTFPLLNASYQGKDRGMAYGLWGAVAGASAAVGPILGGLLVQGISWRWVFFVNLPVSVAALVMCARALPADRPEMRWRVDVPGVVTFTVAVTALTYGLIRTGEHGWAGPTYVLLGVAAAMLAAFIVLETRVAEPLLDLGLFKAASFSGTMLAGLVLNLTAFSILTYTSIWLQSLLGLGPIAAGLTGLPLAGLAFVVAAVIGRRLHDAAPGPIIATGLASIGLGGIVTALLLNSGSRWPALVPGYVLIGIGVGLGTPTLSAAAMSAVAPRRAGMAAGALNTVRQLGYAVGIAVLGSVVAGGATASLRDAHVADAPAAAHALVGGQAQLLLGRAGTGRAQLTAALHAANVHGLVRASTLVGVIGLVAAVLVFVLVRRPSAGPTEGQALAAPALVEPAVAV